MIIADDNNFSCMFDDDFVKGAATLFTNLGLIDGPLILNYSREVRYWIYEALSYSIRLNQEDYEVLSNIQLGGEITPSIMGNGENIRIFAIELQPGADRSQKAYDIHRIFSRVVGDCSIILYRQENNGERYCMFSLDIGNNIVLSDWYSLCSEARTLENVQLQYLSRTTARTFQCDLAYFLERSYYHQLSKIDSYVILLESSFETYCVPHVYFDREKLLQDAENLRLKRECKIVCVNRYCMNLLYAPYWGKQR